MTDRSRHGGAWMTCCTLVLAMGLAMVGGSQGSARGPDGETATESPWLLVGAAACELGGYRVWTGFHSHVAKGSGEAIVDEAVRRLEELKRS